jgi:ribosomal protein S18 acetylase RimI-like enzyme
MIRDLRRTDSPRLFALLEGEFPEESALLGSRPEAFEKVVRRVFRWDSRVVLGLLRLVGRRIFRLLVIEADQRLVATTLVTFPAVSAYVSNVVVDPAYRRRGYAKAMLEEARRTAGRARRKFVVLDVLDSNTGARALYESAGYRPLRSRTQFVHDAASAFATAAAAHRAIRPFRRTDAHALAEVVRRQTPPEIEEVLPVEERAFVGSAFATRLLASEESAWVIDRGHGAEGHIAATVSETFEAGHVSAPVLAESVDPPLAGALVRTAGAWCAARKAPRILSLVADDNPRGRAALEAAGFRPAFGARTLYRRVA